MPNVVKQCTFCLSSISEFLHHWVGLPYPSPKRHVTGLLLVTADCFAKRSKTKVFHSAQHGRDKVGQKIRSSDISKHNRNNSFLKCTVRERCNHCIS